MHPVTNQLLASLFSNVKVYIVNNYEIDEDVIAAKNEYFDQWNVRVLMRMKVLEDRWTLPTTVL